MASKTAILTVRVVSDVKSAVKGLGEVEDRASGLEGGLKKAAAPAAGVVAALGAIASTAVSSASELQQSAGAVESVFGQHAAAVEAASKTAANSVGLAASEYNNLSSVLGAQLKNMGTSQDELAGSTQNLISLGADLAATFGGTTADAVGAISALLRGERDPIERYGVSIKQSDINARLAAEGLSGLEGAAKTQAEAQAALALLTEQTADAQGQFARETDTAAGSQQIAAAQYENARAALGEQLLPIVTEFMNIMSATAQWVTENSNGLLVLGAVVGGLAGAVLLANGALAVYHGLQNAVKVATAAWSGVQTVFNAVMAANPVTLVVVAITALVAAIIVAYNKCETFRNFINKLWDGFKTGLTVIWDVLKPIRDAFSAIIDVVKTVWDWVSSLFSAFSPPAWLSTVLGWIGLTVGGPESGMIEAAHLAGGPPASAPSPRTLTWARRRPDTQPHQAPVINITVNGALDPMSVAAQIEDLLHRYGVVISGRAVL